MFSLHVYIGVTGIGALALVGADVAPVMTFIGSIPVIAPLAKFSVAFPLLYHYCKLSIR